MYEEMQEYRQPLYKDLRLYWLASLLVAVLGVLDNIAVSIVVFVLGVIQLVALYRMRTISLRMNKAFRWNIIGLVMTIAGLVLALVVVLMAESDPMLYLTGNPITVVLLMLLVALAGAVVMIVANYYFYTALDDLAVVRGYDYPAGRIKWCFWLSIIGSIVSALLNIAEQGTLVIGGRNIQVSELSIQTGELKIFGTIEYMQYSEPVKSPGGFLRRLAR